MMDSMRRKKGYRLILLLPLAAAFSLLLSGCSRSLDGVFPGRRPEQIVRLECDNSDASVEKTIRIPSGQQGTVTAQYSRENGGALITIAREEQKVAGLEITAEAADTDLPEPAGQGLEEQSLPAGTSEPEHGRIETVLECGTYTVKVEAGNYRGTVSCTLDLRETD